MIARWVEVEPDREMLTSDGEDTGVGRGRMRSARSVEYCTFHIRSASLAGDAVVKPARTRMESETACMASGEEGRPNVELLVEVARFWK